MDVLDCIDNVVENLVRQRKRGSSTRAGRRGACAGRVGNDHVWLRSPLAKTDNTVPVSLLLYTSW